MEEAELGSDPLFWLTRRFSSLCRRGNDGNRRVLLAVMQTMVQCLGTAGLVEPLLPPLCRVLHFLISTPSVAQTANDPLVVSEDVKARAQELFDGLQAVVGSAVVLKYFADERGRVMEKRQQRRQQRSMNLLLDPAGAAKRRAMKNKNKRKRVATKLEAWKGPRKRVQFRADDD